METTARTESRSFADPRYQGYQILHVGLTAGSIPFGLDIFEPHGDLGQISGTVDRAVPGDAHRFMYLLGVLVLASIIVALKATAGSLYRCLVASGNHINLVTYPGF